MNELKRERNKLRFITLIALIFFVVSLLLLSKFVCHSVLFILCYFAIFMIFTYFITKQFSIIDGIEKIPTKYTKVKLLCPSKLTYCSLPTNQPIYIKRIGLKTVEITFDIIDGDNHEYYFIFMSYLDACKAVDLNSI